MCGCMYVCAYILSVFVCVRVYTEYIFMCVSVCVLLLPAGIDTYLVIIDASRSCHFRTLSYTPYNVYTHMNIRTYVHTYR